MPETKRSVLEPVYENHHLIFLYCTQLVRTYLMAMPPAAVVRHHAMLLMQVSKTPLTLPLNLLQILLQSKA